jgi:cell wall-associated NlpC family hydrolase
MVVVMRSRRLAVVAMLAGTMSMSLGTLSTSSAVPQRDLQQVARQVSDLQMQAAAATEDAKRAQGQLDDISAHLNAIKDRASRERDDLQMAMSTIDDIARAAYVNGGMDNTLQVLLAENPSEFLAQAAVMNQLEQTQVTQLRQGQTARLRLAQTEAEIADREAAAQDVRDQMTAAQDQAAADLAAAEKVLAGLQEAERQRLAQIAADRRQQQMNDAAAQAAQQAAVPIGSYDSSSGGSRAQAAVQYALSQVGKPYSYSASPPSSWDCSKLTTAAWASAGVGITPLSYTQWDQTRHVPVSDIQPGDLVFYFGGGAHHVAIYIGNGKMVSASNPSVGVEVTDFLGAWYGERFSGVGRVVG